MRNDGTPGYYEALRLRKIYCEGNFSHQKAEHNLRRLRKRGLGKAHEHCLLSATALNLKRMVKLLTTRKHPGVSLRKTLSAIGRSSMLYPMALLSTGPYHNTPARVVAKRATAPSFRSKGIARSNDTSCHPIGEWQLCRSLSWRFFHRRSPGRERTRMAGIDFSSYRLNVFFPRSSHSPGKRADSFTLQKIFSVFF